jgi:hypothetical protein
MLLRFCKPHKHVPEPRMAAAKLPDDVERVLESMSGCLNSRTAVRLILLCTGVLLANGRRTVASWLRGAGIGVDFRQYYYMLGSIGRKVQSMGIVLLLHLSRQLPVGDYILLGIDDTPTKRYGPHVEGAGLHHNPTPGPAQQKFLFGHVWVTLAWILDHACWGAIALPLLARLYVRAKNLDSIAAWNRPKFQTKLEQAGQLLTWDHVMRRSRPERSNAKVVRCDIGSVVAISLSA